MSANELFRCPACALVGDESLAATQVRPTEQTCIATIPFVDERGVHHHDRNHFVRVMECKRAGHRVRQTLRYRCWCGWVGGLTEYEAARRCCEFGDHWHHGHAGPRWEREGGYLVDRSYAPLPSDDASIRRYCRELLSRTPGGGA